jgi:spermidine synthase
MVISLIAIGMISILGQVVLIRELNVAFYGVELIYLLALGIWLLWTAAGALIGRRVLFPSPRQIAALFILFGIVLPIDILFIRSSRIIFGGVPGAYLPILEQLIVVFISLLPAGLLSGLLFQWAAKTYMKDGKTLALAYAIESAGGFIGGFVSTLLIFWGIRNFSAVLLCSLISVITPLFLLKGVRAVLIRWSAILLSCFFLLLLWNTSLLDRRMTMLNHPNLVESSDSPYGRISVTRLQNQISVFENDALAFETEGTESEYFCHLTALQHPNPKDVLILGGGIEGLVREMLKYTPQRIHYIELNPVLFQLTIHHLPDDIRKSLYNPNVRIVFADPRRYLKESGSYDLILVGMPQPSSGQTNRFYTREFFEQCRGKLKHGGILGFRLHTAENLWTVPLARRNTSINRALQSVFPETLFLPGSTNVVTASNASLPESPEIMFRRLQNRQPSTRLISKSYIEYLFTNDRYYKIRDLLHHEHAPANTDIRPVCYPYAIIIWLSQFYPRIALLDPFFVIDRGFLKSSWVWLSGIGFIIFLLVIRVQPALKRIILVAAAGFTGMVLETILLLYYQVTHGVLYQDIGILMMSFMAGLAAGAMAIHKKMSDSMEHRPFKRLYGAFLLIGFCFLCAYTGITLTMGISLGLAPISFLLGASGFAVGGIFAYASIHKVEDRIKVISPLYAADLIGGCVGCLLGSLIFIPLAGMDVTAWGLFLVAALLLILV